MITETLVGLTKEKKPAEVKGNNSVETQAALVQEYFKKLSPEQRSQFMKQYEARGDLLKFTNYTKTDYVTNWHHRIMCNELDDFIRSPTRRRLMIFVGPRRGKSEIVSRRLPAYALGLNPDLNVVGTSYGAKLATAMCRDVQRIIDSPKYLELFPETRLNSSYVKSASKRNYIRTSDRFEIVDRNGGYRSAGVDSSLTGVGADLAIIDDPHKDWKEAMSPGRKQDVYDWYLSTFYTRESKIGKIIILMTRWAEDDLCGRLLKDAEADPEADQWEVISFPEMYDPENEYSHPEDPRVEEEVLWPEMYDAEKVKRVKATLGSKFWTSLYQQQPTSDDGVIFSSSWFKYYQELPQFDRIVVSWDFNFGNNIETSDFVAGTVWGISGANKYLINLINERLTFTGSLAEIQRVHYAHPNASYTVIEGKANGPAIVDVVKGRIAGVMPYMPTVSKVTRARATSPQFEVGNIFLPDMYYKVNRDRYPWMAKLLNKFIEQFKAFPFGDNDDMVDSTVQMLLQEMETPAWLQSASQPVAPGETRDIEQDRRDRLVAEIFGWQNKLGTYNNPEDHVGYRLGF